MRSLRTAPGSRPCRTPEVRAQTAVQAPSGAILGRILRNSVHSAVVGPSVAPRAARPSVALRARAELRKSARRRLSETVNSPCRADSSGVLNARPRFVHSLRNERFLPTQVVRAVPKSSTAPSCRHDATRDRTPQLSAPARRPPPTSPEPCRSRRRRPSRPGDNCGGAWRRPPATAERALSARTRRRVRRGSRPVRLTARLRVPLVAARGLRPGLARPSSAARLGCQPRSRAPGGHGAALAPDARRSRCHARTARRGDRPGCAVPVAACGRRHARQRVASRLDRRIGGRRDPLDAPPPVSSPPAPPRPPRGFGN